MKLQRQTVFNLLLIPLAAVALYSLLVKCDLLFLLGFQVVWLIASAILLRNSDEDAPKR